MHRGLDVSKGAPVESGWPVIAERDSPRNLPAAALAAACDGRQEHVAQDTRSLEKARAAPGVPGAAETLETSTERGPTAGGEEAAVCEAPSHAPPRVTGQRQLTERGLKVVSGGSHPCARP